MNHRPFLVGLLALSALAIVPAPAQAGPVEDVGDIVFGITDCYVFGPCQVPCTQGDDCVGRLVEEVCGTDGCGDELDYDQYCPDDNCVGYINGLIDPYTRDSDRDGYHDSVETTLCGRPAVRDLINNPNVPGSCTSATNFVGPPVGPIGPLPPIGPWVEFVQDTVGDTDGDFVPNNLEPALCNVEDQTTSLDGTCAGSNYDPPFL